VVPDRGAKTISSETTFETDIRDFATLRRCVATVGKSIVAPEDSAIFRPNHQLKLKRPIFSTDALRNRIHADPAGGEDFLISARCWRRRSMAPRSG